MLFAIFYVFAVRLTTLSERDSTASCTRMSSGQWIAKICGWKWSWPNGTYRTGICLEENHIRAQSLYLSDEFRCIMYILDNPVRNCGSE